MLKPRLILFTNNHFFFESIKYAYYNHIYNETIGTINETLSVDL